MLSSLSQQTSRCLYRIRTLHHGSTVNTASVKTQACEVFKISQSRAKIPPGTAIPNGK